MKPATHRLSSALAATLVTLFALPCAPATASAADPFEGQIDMIITAPSGKETSRSDMIYYIKPGKMRMDVVMAGQPDGRKKTGGETQTMTVTTYLDLEKQEMYILIPGQKMYMQYSMADQKPAKFKEAEIDFKPTGRKDVILGYEVEEYANAAKSDYTEMWLTKDLGKFVMASSNAGGKSQKQSSWEKYAADNSLFALRVIQYKKKGGAETFRLDVTKVTPGAQPDALFELPAGYQKFSIGNMLKGLGKIGS